MRKTNKSIKKKRKACIWVHHTQNLKCIPQGGMNLLNSTPVLMGLYVHEMARHLDLAMVLDPERHVILHSSTGRQSFSSELSTVGQVGKATGPSSI